MKIVNPTDTRFLDDIALGNVPGKFIMDKFGANHNIGTGQAADIWSGGEDTAGNQIYNYGGFNVTVAETVDVTSTSDLDTELGTGANYLLIEGLDQNYDIVNCIVALNGIAGITTECTFLRVYRMLVLTAGTTGANQGDIYATTTTGGVRMAQIEPLVNQTLMALYTVPRNHTALLLSIFASIGKKNVAVFCDIEGYVRPFGGVFLLRLQRGLMTFGTSHFDIGVTTPTFIPEKSDIKVRSGIPSANDISVTAGFGLLVEQIVKE